MIVSIFYCQEKMNYFLCLDPLHKFLQGTAISSLVLLIHPLMVNFSKLCVNLFGNYPSRAFGDFNKSRILHLVNFRQFLSSIVQFNMSKPLFYLSLNISKKGKKKQIHVIQILEHIFLEHIYLVLSNHFYLYFFYLYIGMDRVHLVSVHLFFQNIRDQTTQKLLSYILIRKKIMRPNKTTTEKQHKNSPKNIETRHLTLFV